MERCERENPKNYLLTKQVKFHQQQQKSEIKNKLTNSLPILLLLLNCMDKETKMYKKSLSVTRYYLHHIIIIFYSFII